MRERTPVVNCGSIFIWTLLEQRGSFCELSDLFGLGHRNAPCRRVVGWDSCTCGNDVSNVLEALPRDWLERQSSRCPSTAKAS